jgi:hypothetical protein
MALKLSLRRKRAPARAMETPYLVGAPDRNRRMVQCDVVVWLNVSKCIDSLDMVYEGDLRLE